MGDYGFKCHLSDKELYHYVAHTTALTKAYEEEGKYAPSVVKMVTVMAVMNKTPEDFEAIAAYLLKNNEGLDQLASELA